jgi:hypothetical protein
VRRGVEKAAGYARVRVPYQSESPLRRVKAVERDGGWPGSGGGRGGEAARRLLPLSRKKKQRKATMFDAGVAVSLCRRGPYP